MTTDKESNDRVIERLRVYAQRGVFYPAGNAAYWCDGQAADLSRLVAYAKEMRAATEWRPIESAPSKGKRILIFRPSKYGKIGVVEIAWHIPRFFEENTSEEAEWLDDIDDASGTSYIKAGWYHDFDDEHYEPLDTNPTHWLPLPATPDKEGA